MPSNEPYVPTIEEVREHYIGACHLAYPELSWSEAVHKFTPVFDSWLREHDAEVIEKAAAMLEGVAAEPWNRHTPAIAILRERVARIRRGED